MDAKKYVHLRGCGILKLTNGKDYDCGERGGNVMFLDSRSIYEDSGVGNIQYIGIATKASAEELFFAPEDVHMGAIMWDGSHYALKEYKDE